jgi:hypothetical protein
VLAASTFAARAGAHMSRLSGTRRLPAGSYRLTLAPARGAARSLRLRVG